MGTGLSRGEGPVKRRIDVLDALRGFALLGILLANIHFFSGAVLDLPSDAGGPVEDGSRWLVHLLVHGKFYSLFSFLFGIGFGIQLSKPEAKQATAARRFRRRMGLLFLIGLAHLIFLWAGDILTLYAVLGLCLLPLRRLSDRTLLRGAIVLLLVPIVIHALAVGVMAIWPPSVPDALVRDPDRMVRVYRHGSYGRILADNMSYEVINRLFSLVGTGRVFKVLATFMFGMWTWRRGIPGDLDAHRGLLRKTVVWGGVLGLGGSTGVAFMMETDLYASLAPSGILYPIFYLLGVPSLALAYAAGFGLLWLRAGPRALLQGFAPAGKMALTNYVGQTLAGVSLFYGYGLGLYGSVGWAGGIAIAAVVFAAQAVASALWLQRFRYGPLEWIWRCLTYRKLLRLLRSPREASPG